MEGVEEERKGMWWIVYSGTSDEGAIRAVKRVNGLKGGTGNEVYIESVFASHHSRVCDAASLTHCQSFFRHLMWNRARCDVHENASLHSLKSKYARGQQRSLRMGNVYVPEIRI